MAGVLPVAVPLAETASPGYEAAAQLLERAVQAGCQDANVLYMLAMAHKRQGKLNEARNALRKIPRPDANIVLQMGLLSLQENQLAQAEGELVRAWEMDPQSYEICYNLLLTRLTLGKVEDCLSLLPTVLELAAHRPANDNADEQRFLLVLQALLQSCRKSDIDAPSVDPVLKELTAADEQRLLQVLRSLGQLDTVHTLLKTLSEGRPRSTAVHEAYLEAVLVKAKELIDRCAWTDALLLLGPLERDKSGSRATQLVLLNLLGCCACMTQDFDSAIKHFLAAIKLAPNDPRLHQNLALTYELKGELPQADPFWNRFFDLLDNRVPVPSNIPRYLDHLTYESLGRLAARYSEKEKWTSALNYVQRAAHLRPNDPDTLERLFQLYNQAKRPQDARRTLDKLRQLRPGEPQYELYELDLIDVKGLSDIEKLLAEIERILNRYPNDVRVEERAVHMVGNVIPLMGNLCEQLSEQMNKVIEQVRNLPNYQINWSAVREVMRDLLREFQKLRRITGKCLPLVSSDEHRRIIRDLGDHIDKKMEACRSVGA
ncbi:MAG TPA: tetratricopeptide repeat protein [Gemmataceae bacterium]|nr:tetratricopeptide repeat protein [Gemmataceae bacterium]